jgi:hypothetical protein
MLGVAGRLSFTPAKFNHTLIFIYFYANATSMVLNISSGLAKLNDAAGIASHCNITRDFVSHPGIQQ